MARKTASRRPTMISVGERIRPGAKPGARQEGSSPQVNYQLLRALEESRAIRARVREELGGKQIPSVVDLIHEGLA